MLDSLVKHRRVAVKSSNGLGKGFCAAVALLWFLHSHQEAAIALSTAPTFRQGRHVLWRQIRRLFRPKAELLGGKILDTRWEISDDCYAMGLSAENADQFQGFHSPNMLIMVDEAEGVSDEIYEAIEAVMTAADLLLLLVGNSTTVSGAFRRAFYEERQIYHNITISALDSPDVKAGKTLVPGLTSAKWVEERRETWARTIRSPVLIPWRFRYIKMMASTCHPACKSWRPPSTAVPAGAVDCLIRSNKPARVDTRLARAGLFFRGLDQEPVEPAQSAGQVLLAHLGVTQSGKLVRAAWKPDHFHLFVQPL